MKTNFIIKVDETANFSRKKLILGVKSRKWRRNQPLPGGCLEGARWPVEATGRWKLLLRWKVVNQRAAFWGNNDMTNEDVRGVRYPPCTDLNSAGMPWGARGMSGPPGISLGTKSPGHQPHWPRKSLPRSLTLSQTKNCSCSWWETVRFSVIIRHEIQPRAREQATEGRRVVLLYHSTSKLNPKLVHFHVNCE